MLQLKCILNGGTSRGIFPPILLMINRYTATADVLTLLGISSTTIANVMPIHISPEKYHIIQPGHEKTCLIPYANNKGADQPAHPRSLISAFVVRCLDSVVPILAKSKISRL